MCTSLAPVIGYDKAAKIAKIAYETGRTMREVALETSGLDKGKIAELLDARSQTEPGSESEWQRRLTNNERTAAL